jgi:tRNA modification GTPase
VVVVPTGGQRFEIHCHGGSAAIRRVIRDLSLVGVQEVSPRPTGGLPARDESTGGNRLGDRLISEACEALTQCTTVRTAAIVLDQVRGALRQWRDDSIDALRRQADQAHRIATEAEQLAAAGRVGVRLARPFDVVLAGLPNVGKSSLINALVGYDRSIVMEIAGTTRDVLNAETVLDGWPIRMRDTAGLHASVESIEQQGIERAMTAIDSADLVLLVTQPGGEGRQSRLHRAINRLGPTIPVIRVLNKSDLIDIDIREGEEVRDRDLIKTIATTGEGIPLLLRAISNALGRGMPAPGAPVPINARQRRWVDGIAALADDPQAMLDALSS